MFKNYLPHMLPENWLISELDQDNEYLELLGHNEEFLVSIMNHEYDNPAKPYLLCLSQLKGILDRYDFEKLNWPEWFETAEEAVHSAVQIMEWINQAYKNFIPFTMEVLVSIGTEDQLPLIKGHFEGDLKVHDFRGQTLIFKKVSLLGGSNSYEESAMVSLCDFAKTFALSPEEMKGGLLTNEKFELIEDLRSKLLNRLISMSNEHL